MAQIQSVVKVKNLQMHTKMSILICMRTTLNLNDKIFEQASKLTGIKEKTQLLHEGLKTLIAKESAKRLSKLGGSAPLIQKIARR